MNNGKVASFLDKTSSSRSFRGDLLLRGSPGVKATLTPTSSSPCFSPSEDHESFRAWLKNRRGLSEDTVVRYMQELLRTGSLQPEEFLGDYRRWKFVAFRLYVHYLYQMGRISAEGKARWLDLLKLKKQSIPDVAEVKTEDIARIMNGKHDGLVDILYWSGIRITEALYLCRCREGCLFEDMDGFRRYSVKWSRGPKRCDYAYLPSFVALNTSARETEHMSMYCGSGVKPKLLRKFFYRTAKACALDERKDPLIADFYQSRVSKMSIGERHYGCLREEADKLYPKVMERLRKSTS